MGKRNPAVLRLRGRHLTFIIFGGVIYILADKSDDKSIDALHHEQTISGKEMHPLITFMVIALWLLIQQAPLVGVYSDA